MLELRPVTITQAKEFVKLHHRHHPPPQGALFAVGVCLDNDLVGVAIIGRPVARGLQDGYTAEVTRACVIEGVPNANSMLYGAAWRAARALGYKKMISYILESEPGTSLKAAGWKKEAFVRGRSWSCESRPREDKHPTVNKERWEIKIDRT